MDAICGWDSLIVLFDWMEILHDLFKLKMINDLPVNTLFTILMIFWYVCVSSKYSPQLTLSNQK